MGQYLRGDVLLAPVELDNRSGPKTRPVIVIATTSDGFIQVCPVSSKPPVDAPSRPLCIDDFSSGGLDLFSESYVMTARVTTIRTGTVIGKKGRLTMDSFQEIMGLIPPAILPGADPHRQKAGRRRT
jgi:hypothetical protein